MRIASENSSSPRNAKPCCSARSFVSGVPHDADDAAIVSTIIAMAHSLGLTVVAEGVETEEQLAFLQDRGCDEYQGFLFSRPVAASEWGSLLERDAGNS